MPVDSDNLRANLLACLPSLTIEHVAAESGQRVVYFGRFDDSKIPPDVQHPESNAPPFLFGWQLWGKVVIKVVQGATAEALSRLQAETAILQELRPNNFPHLLFSDLFVENPLTDEVLTETLYVSVEEYIESTTLTQCLSDYIGREAAVASLALRLVDALLPLWTHSKRFVHRDLKPANILVKPNGEIVVIDLGIARETGSPGVTQDGWGRAPLTLDYAAPEQIENDKEAISFKTDFFAIGVLMYVLVSGSHPFNSSQQVSPFDLAEKVLSVTPPSLASLGLSSPQFSETVEMLLAKKPFQRPRTPAILVQMLNALGGTV